MKKIILIGVIILIQSFTLANSFPLFPMTIYGNIQIGETPLDGGIIKVYNTSDEELTTYEITETGKYGSDNVSKLPLLLNEFEGNLSFKVLYEGKTYIIDEIDDSNKKDQCPNKSSITFVSDNCRYNITLKEEIEENNTGETNTGNANTGEIDNGTTNNGNINTGNSNNYSSQGGSSHKDSKQKNSEGEHNSADIPSDNQTTSDNSSNTQLPENKEEMQENGLTNELNKAYQFSYNNGITTKENIKEANMKGYLTRISAAKILSHYAMNILGKKPDISKGILRFNDVSNELNERYNNAITLSYQLGIMGINSDGYFRPHDIITRAEFATALSRMLYGTENGTELYYTTHLNKLKKEGVIKNTNPNLKEIRGFAMLMLMRASTKN